MVLRTTFAALIALWAVSAQAELPPLELQRYVEKMAREEVARQMAFRLPPDRAVGQGQLQDLHAALAATEARLQRLDEAIEASSNLLETRLRQVDQSIEASSKDLESRVQRLDQAIEASSKALDTRLQQVDAALAESNKTFETLGQGSRRWADRLQEMSVEMRGLEDRIEAVAKGGAANAQITVLRGHIQRLERLLVEPPALPDEIDQRLAALEASVRTSVREQPVERLQMVEEASKQSAHLYTALVDRLNRLEHLVVQTAGAAPEVDSDIVARLAALEAAERSQRGAAGTASAAASMANGVAARLDAIEARNQDLDGLRARVEALTLTVADVQRPDLASQHSQLATRVAELEQFSRQQDEIRAQVAELSAAAKRPAQSEVDAKFGALAARMAGLELLSERHDEIKGEIAKLAATLETVRSGVDMQTEALRAAQERQYADTSAALAALTVRAEELEAAAPPARDVSLELERLRELVERRAAPAAAVAGAAATPPATRYFLHVEYDDPATARSAATTLNNSKLFMVAATEAATGAGLPITKVRAGPYVNTRTVQIDAAKAAKALGVPVHVLSDSGALVSTIDPR